MNKKQFIDLIKSEMENMTYKQKIAFLEKIEENYIPEVIRECQQKEGYWVPKEKENLYFRCNKCKKYTLKDKIKSEKKIETYIEMVHTDAGYGDDDEMGEVEYLVLYKQCPHCNNKQKVETIFLEIKERWNAKEGRK